MLPSNNPLIFHLYEIQNLATFIACTGFAILFNIHGFGIAICAFGGMITWIVYCVADYFGLDIYTSYFIAAVVAAIYAEVMARIRKYPAISYLVISIFPLIPGAGVYYSVSHAVQGDMAAFASRGMHTAAIAGIMAVGILIASTTVRIISDRVQRVRKNQ